MKVVCPNCHSVYSVKDEFIPAGGAGAKCPRCEYLIPLAREASAGLDREPDYGKTMILFMPLPAQQEVQEDEVLSALMDAQEGMPEGAELSLVVEEGDEPGRRYPLTGTRTTIGRSRTDITLRDPEVSRSHAAVEVYGDKLIIKDLSST